MDVFTDAFGRPFEIDVDLTILPLSACCEADRKPGTHDCSKCGKVDAVPLKVSVPDDPDYIRDYLLADV